MRRNQGVTTLVLVSFFLSACSLVGEPEPFQNVLRYSKPIAISGELDGALVGEVPLPLGGAEVILFKVQGKQREELQRVVSDASGMFAFSDVESSVMTNGIGYDYYYEFESSHRGFHLMASIAPRESAYIRIDILSTVHTHLLRETISRLPENRWALPSPETFDLVSRMVNEELRYMKGDIEKLSAKRSRSHRLEKFGQGLLHAANNSALAAHRFYFEAWWYGLRNNEATVDEWAVYMRDIMQTACAPLDDFVALPFGIAQAVGASAQAGRTFSVQEVIDAYVSANQNQIDRHPEEVLADFQAQIQQGYAALNDEGVDYRHVERMQKLFVYSLRRLGVNDIDFYTRLDPDQAVVLWMYLESGGETIRLCKPATKMLAHSFFLLTQDARLDRPAVMEAQIYHVDSQDCRRVKKVALQARVFVNAPAHSDEDRLHSVRVKSSDETALITNSTHQASMFLKDGDRDNMYAEELDDACVSPDKDVSYTVEARMFAMDTQQRQLKAATHTLNTRHWTLKKPQISYADGAPVSYSYSKPTRVDEKRPVMHLPAQDEMLSGLEGVPEGAKIKYSYRFRLERLIRYYSSGTSECETPATSTLFEGENVLISDVCDTQRCADLNSIADSMVQCRIDVYAHLVDRENRILSRSPLSYGYFRVKPE
ncbi:MAG: hypothetical protein OEZ43_08910 [Gammaproteobacteria bacterium]|nr:hypothetical protein [Gammaproteobacteria bacterium]